VCRGPYGDMIFFVLLEGLLGKMSLWYNIKKAMMPMLQ